MNNIDLKKALSTSTAAARAAGAVMRANARSVKKINEESQHDIKLELDVRCQKLIERRLRAAFPAVAILGEEGTLGDTHAATRWVVDPIDGTVNFTYGIPHACVSIALQVRRSRPLPAFRSAGAANHTDACYETVIGVVYDPFCDELWTAIRGQPARLNGRPVTVSSRSKLPEVIISVGFAKYRSTLERMLPPMNALILEVRKLRILGAAALSLTYVASGRMDAYIEYGLRLWDIAAGGLIIECAGGEFFFEPVEGEHAYRIIANNGRIRRSLERVMAKAERSLEPHAKAAQGAQIRN